MRALAAAAVIAVVLAGCSTSPSGSPTGTIAPTSPTAPGSAAPSTQRKVLVIAEENHGYHEIIGSAAAPFLNQLAGTYGTATRFDAGYPPQCPSLAAYILLTSGTTAGICDDKNPAAHPLSGENIFHQVAGSGQEWRNYAESAPGPCPLTNSADGRYLVRHVPATYYLDQRTQCAQWTVPLGTPTGGALHDDVAAGRLPAYGFVSPDACNDMHGGGPCQGDMIAAGDRWLQAWLQQIVVGPDYTSGRLVVVITWDEGTSTDNHVATLVISPTTSRITSDRPFTHCSILRAAEDLLGLPPLGCAAGAPSMVTAFHL
jgi:phosphatidylinositol-3-phosphatase